MYLLSIQDKTLFCKFFDIYPECGLLVQDQPKLFPLICLESECHRNSNCFVKIAHRVQYIFDQFPKATLLILYFSYRNEPDRLRAGVFWRDFENTRFVKINKS